MLTVIAGRLPGGTTKHNHIVRTNTIISKIETRKLYQ